jgi:hypothetical protein
MICISSSKQGAEILLDYCAGRLDAARTAELESHLRECAACREMAVAQHMVWEVLDAWKPVVASPDFDARLHARIAGEEREPWWRRMLARPLIPATTAGAVFALTLVLVLVPHSSAPPQQVPQVVSGEIDVQELQQALDDMDMLTPVGQTASKAL